MKAILKAWKPEKGEKFELAEVGNATVKIYRRERSNDGGETRFIYEVADFTGGRRRLNGFKDLVKARKDAERIARQLSSGQATAAQMTNPQSASYGRAVELIRPTGASLEHAASTYAKIWEILGDDSAIEAARFFKLHRADQVTRRTVAEVVGELIAAKESRGKSERYIGDLRARLNKFAESFAVDISTLATADVQRWLDRLDVSPQTAKNFRTVLHTLFAFAESRGYVFKGGNPVADTESIEANGGEIQIYTPDEVLSLLNSAPSDFLPLVALGAFAGLRAAEAERIDWQAIDLAGGFIHVGDRTAKTRSRRLVPILPNLAQWLAPYAERKGKVWQGSLVQLRDARAEATMKAGVAWKQNALRHSFVSYRLADIQNAAQVALEAGNSPQMVFKHYRELVKPDAAKAWFSIAPEAPANVVPMTVSNQLTIISSQKDTAP